MDPAVRHGVLRQWVDVLYTSQQTSENRADFYIAQKSRLNVGKKILKQDCSLFRTTWPLMVQPISLKRNAQTSLEEKWW